MKATGETLDLDRARGRIADELLKPGALERLLVPAEVSEILRVEVATLDSWRSKGLGPIFVKFGRDVRYRPSDVRTFIEDRVCRSTWESEMRKRQERV